MKNPLFILILSVFSFYIFSCTREIHHFEYNQVVDGKYDSEFPVKPTSQKLIEILESVRLISILTFYESYDFTEASKITARMLTGKLIKEQASVRYSYERPSTGSATIVYNRDDRIALLTCAHIVDFPDTIITYHKDSFGKETPYIQNVSIKLRQNNNLIDLPELRDFRILTVDRSKDLALIGREVPAGSSFSMRRDLSANVKQPIPVINCKLGLSVELNWGCFVYMIGYPRAKKMISTAVVSSPNYDQRYSFLLDGSLQRGISGGLVLAIRDGVPNFELVGITNAVSSETQYFLQPEKDFDLSDWDLSRPYSGEIYARAYKSIYYGITYAIGIESILDFIRSREGILSALGYEVGWFFKE